MTDSITITVDDAQVRAMFARLSGLRDLTPLMRDLGETLTESTQKRFETGTAPDGSKWKALADGSGRTPLRKSGTMRDRITPHAAATFVEILASARQARWHQEGTKPYVIQAKPGKALYWPGMRTRIRKKDGKEVPGFVTKVNHPGLPARPFMGVSAKDAQDITALGEAFLESLASGRSG
jgi:phage virion morphogenesis protein